YISGLEVYTPFGRVGGGEITSLRIGEGGDQVPGANKAEMSGDIHLDAQGLELPDDGSDLVLIAGTTQCLTPRGDGPVLSPLRARASFMAAATASRRRSVLGSCNRPLRSRAGAVASMRASHS